MTDYFTADLHLGHGKVAELRGHSSTIDHNVAILDSLMEATSPGDHLWILGDLTGGRESDEKAALAMLYNCVGDRYLHLIPGNHDSCHPLRSTAHKHLPRFHEAFDTIQNQASLKIAGTRAVMSHHPYSGDHTPHDRDLQWRPRDLGAPIIHGHTHATAPVSYSHQGTLQICVSLDAHDMKPVSKDTLTQLIQENRHG